ncbi:MAG: COX15/CtaA family protein [Ardenticatenaceae bacterium]|nr:COX15/CtaA family protein [Ardenticatenaceae bacterium]MCB8989752.1 COX15/CtaA family protein [Ardenticatenaceae bacterium]MCB9002789.1 COX15/CtaA family protein [Ardenticatenaceae bacterium]
MKQKQFTNFAWFVVAYTIAVVLWGAFVRATGSGAGCGSHWPTCNGQAIPRPEQIETIIEYAHRITSALNGLFVVGLLIGAFRFFSKGHLARRGAVLSFVFIIIEGLLGAALVRFDWVVDNVSLGRIVASGIHLINTSILVSVIALTAWWGGGGKALRWRNQGQVAWLLGIAFVGYLILSASGAMTALGDTVFPSETLTEGILADMNATSHFLVRLRIWHPVIAIVLGIYLVLAGSMIYTQRPSAETQKYAQALKVIFGVQLAAGFVNVLLLAPVWMQMIHLLLANVVLITLVLLGMTALSHEQPAMEAPSLAAQT